LGQALLAAITDEDKSCFVERPLFSHRSSEEVAI
jgi:hypothetical protein